MEDNNTISSYQQNDMRPIISLSNFIVLLSGSVIIPSGEYVQFQFDDLIFRFKNTFESEKESDFKTAIETEPEGTTKYFLFDFINTRPGQNGGLSLPMPVATLNEKDLLVIFKNEAYPIDEQRTNIILTYTWLQKK